MRPTKELLVAVRKLIERPENWTKGAYSREPDGYGYHTIHDPHKAYMVSFCLEGACIRVAETVGEAQAVIDNLCGELRISGADTESLVLFNDADSRTHAEVLALVDAAIAHAD